MFWISSCLLIVVCQENVPSKEFRQVEIVVPSITCHSRFEESLKKKIRDKHDWIRSVQVLNQNRKILKERPRFDLGDDAILVFTIKSDRKVKELAMLLHRSGFYANTELWQVRSGHKMRDRREIPFKEWIEKKK